MNQPSQKQTGSVNVGQPPQASSLNIGQPPQTGSLNIGQPLKTGSLNIGQPPKRQSVQLISLSPPEEKDLSWPNSNSHTAICMDLEGIDFSAPPKETSDIKSSSSMEDVTAAGSKNIYPDIRSAFRLVPCFLLCLLKQAGPSCSKLNKVVS